METEHSLRRRIKTVGELHAIVRTMKALAAVSVRQYEALLKSLDEYTQTVEMGMQVALHGRVFHQPDRKQPASQLAAVIFGSDVGLCGRFNEDLIAYALDKMNGFQVTQASRSVLAVGSRIDARLSELGHPVEETIITPGSATAVISTVRQILAKIDEWQDRAIEQVLLFYSQSDSPRLLHLLPVDLRQFSRLSQKPWPSRIRPCFSLDAERLLAALIRQHLFVCLFRACSESLTAENQMRLRAMQAAEKHVQDKLDELLFQFRNQRQNTIDAEILDIGAGFEAVSNQS